MVVPVLLGIAVSFLVAPAASSPLHQGGSGLNPSRVVYRDDGDATYKCTLPTDDPAGLWDHSNAKNFLSDFLSDNGPVNWLQNMDQKLTTAGGQSTSNLDCVDFPDTGNCQSPTIQCQYFTPPEQFYVRVASANFYQFMRGLYRGLSDFVSNDAALRIDNVYDDWTPPPGPTDNPFGILIGAAVLGFLFPVSAASGALLNGAIGVLNTLSGSPAFQSVPSSLDPTKALKNQLATIWDGEKVAMEQYIQTAFGGAIPDGVGGGFGSSNPTDIINGLFADGAWNIPGVVDGNGKGQIDQILDPVLDRAGKSIMQLLAVSTIKANKNFIFVDTSRNQDDCNGIIGSRWINNQCYFLGSAGKARNQVGGSEVRDMVKAMDRDRVLQLDDPSKGYDFDVNGFYQSAQECQDNGGGNVDLANILSEADQGKTYARCFVNIPVIKADQTPCNDGSNDWSSLGYDKNFCNPPPSGGGPPCPGGICH